MKKSMIVGISMSMLISTVSAAPQAKHLAGPAAEIALLKYHPETTAIVSKHAMVPVQMSADKSGQLTWQQNIPVEGNNPKLLVFSPGQANWGLQLKQAGSSAKDQSMNFGLVSKQTNFGMGAQQFPATQYDLENLTAGVYNLGFSADKNSADEGYVLISSDSPYRLKSYLNAPGYLVGDVIQINASATTDENKFTMVTQDFGMIESAYMKITQPDQLTYEKGLFDGNQAVNKNLRDGEFMGEFEADQPGLYQVQVVTHGTTPAGEPFFRTVEHVIPVIDTDLTLASHVASGSYVDNHKINIDIAVDTAIENKQYRVLAEVWGTDSGAKSSGAKAATWLSTIVAVEQGSIKLQLDDRWLLAEKVSAPYHLQNLRIQDTEHYIDVLNAKQLQLNLPAISQASKASFTGAINESMLVGNKPIMNKAADATGGVSTQAAGGKLMLVHGYCSGDAWGPVQSQFSNNVKFTDFNQNRSHDAFAQLIDSYGDNFPSFGVVAHSQGGAAALHLYTYYWSGLDDAGSGRLIQSVGTPYQGTPLAGNLALIGDIFGIGCGYNSNLTTSGASAWLSGIPTWARSKVRYYTTSYTDKWWRYDYCNFASDLVLSDPEDGTTERSRGQLSGATNGGHKTGQCHTEGMRDMAQTRDGSRNSNMSANAAR